MAELAGLAAFAGSRSQLTFESPTIERTSDMIKLVLYKQVQVDLWAVGTSEEVFIPARRIKQ